MKLNLKKTIIVVALLLPNVMLFASGMEGDNSAHANSQINSAPALYIDRYIGWMLGGVILYAFYTFTRKHPKF